MIERLRLVARRRGPALDFLPVARIAADALHLRDGSLRAVMECPTLAFGIKGEADQRAVIDGWTALLNSLAHPLEVVIRSRQLEAGELAPLPAGREVGATAALRDSYRRLVQSLADERRVVDRRFLVVVPMES